MAVLLLAIVLTGAAEGSAEAEDRVRYLWSFGVEKGETVEDAVCVFCSVRSAGNAEDVVAVWGSVEIVGGTTADVVAVGGGVRVRAGATVDGDVVAIGGPVIVEPGAKVTGEIEAHPFYHLPGQRQVFWQGAAGLAGFNLIVVLLGFLLVRRRRVENMARTLRARPWMTPVVGAVFVVLMFGLYRVPWLTPRLYNTWGSVYAMTTILLAIPYAAGFIAVCSFLGSSTRLGAFAFECGSLRAAVCGAIAVTVLMLLPLAGLVAWALVVIFTTGVALVSRFGARTPAPSAIAAT
jgi:hypothetical protein